MTKSEIMKFSNSLVRDLMTIGDPDFAAEVFDVLIAGVLFDETRIAEEQAREANDA